MNYKNLYFTLDGKLSCEYPQDAHAAVTTYELNSLPPFVPLQRKSSLDVILVTQGQLKLLANGETYFLREGDVAIISPFSPYTVRATEVAPLKATAISANLQECARLATGISRFVHLFADGRAVPTVYGDNAPTLTRLAELTTAIRSCSDTDKSMTLLEQLLQTLYDNREHHASTIADAKQSFFAVKMAEQLTELTKAPKVAELAARYGYSEFYAMKLFKRYADCSVVDYSNKYRVSVAMQMITGTNREIAEIAREVGFDNVSYFNRQFKSLFGKTPKQFRN